MERKRVNPLNGRHKSNLARKFGPGRYFFITPDLAELISAWPGLSPEVREVVLAIVHTGISLLKQELALAEVEPQQRSRWDYEPIGLDCQISRRLQVDRDDGNRDLILFPRYPDKPYDLTKPRQFGEFIPPPSQSGLHIRCYPLNVDQSRARGELAWPHN